MAFHSKRSPSKAERFIECPGTFALCNALPDQIQTQAGDAARLGTATHGLIERVLKNGEKPEDYKDRIIEILDNDEEEGVAILRKGAKTPGAGRHFYIVDSDMIDNADVMVNYVRERCAELGVEESALEMESRTNPLPDRDDTSGTADVTIPAWPEVLEVVDYKNGYITVEHENNKQLLAYLLGKALESEWSYEAYKVTVVQPNADHEDGRIRSFDATKKELLAFQKEYRAAIEKCEEAEISFIAARCDSNDEAWAATYLKAGDHCTFCEAQATCPARIALAQNQALVEFKEEPRELDYSQDFETVSRILKWAPQLESLIRAASTYAQRAMEAGYTIPGFKLVRGRSTRKWGDMPESVIVKEILRGKFVKDKSALFTQPKLISAPQAVKLVPAKRRKEFEELFVVKPEGNLTITHESDSRPAVVSGAGDDFEAIEGHEFDFETEGALD